MNYCSIEEAWGENLNKEKRKKKKKEKRIYNTNIPEYTYDSSYEYGIHDENCAISDDENFSKKNRHRYDMVRKARPIKKSSRKIKGGNVEISYDKAQKEKNMYKKETKRMKKKMVNNSEAMVRNSNQMGRNSNQNYSRNLENMYMSDLESQNEMTNINDRKNPYGEMTSPSYEQEDYVDMESDDYLQSQPNNMDLIEGFESNQEVMDSYEIDKSERAGNVIDKLMEEKINSNNPSISSNEEVNSESNNQSSDSEISDTDEEKTNELLTDNENTNNFKKVSKKDIDYRLNNLNRNINMIINQMNKSPFFDDDSQDNIHDLILFVLFGIFIIFILDSIYKLGKSSSNNIL